MHHVAFRISFGVSWELKNTIMSGDNFSIANRDTFLDPEPFRAILASEFKDWAFQYEDTKDNLHIQGYGHFKGTLKFRPHSKAKEWQMKYEVMHGVEMQPVHKVDATLRYVSKCDTRVKGPFLSESLERKRLEMDPPKYDGEDIKHIGENLYNWQKYLMEVAYLRPDRRTVNVIVDRQGGAGKSSFVKYAKSKDGNKFLGFGYDKAANLQYAVSEGIKKDPNLERMILVDLSRSKAKDNSIDDIYQAIEQIKNGDMTVGKYASKNVLFRTPHVWVFTNEMPDKKKLSQDRWKIFYLKDNEMYDWDSNETPYPSVQPAVAASEEDDLEREERQYWGSEFEAYVRENDRERQQIEVTDEEFMRYLDENGL